MLLLITKILLKHTISIAIAVISKAFYHLKWENALFASAILCISSLFPTALPSPLAASISSIASFVIIKGLLVFGLCSKFAGDFALAASTIHESAKESLLAPLTSIGTIYDAPPTLLGRTSILGVTFSSALSKTVSA